MTIPEMMEFSNRILREKAMDKYDMFVTASAPHSKKAKEIGNSYLKEVKKFDNKLKPELEPMSEDSVKNLVYNLGQGYKWKVFKNK